jgi:hypothetical protein
VFAALDGIVIEVSDNLPDEHLERTMTPVDNHVIVSSLGRHVHTVYGHLRRGVMARNGQRVVAGQQIGWTASSGHSSWPHLHFTMKLDYEVLEPFAGPCRSGKSYWHDQAAIPTEPYVRDFTFSRKPFGGRRDPPWDEAVRTGTFPRGVQDVHFRTELAFFDGDPMRVTFLGPDGSTAFDAVEPTPLQGSRATFATWHERLSLDRAGTWRLRMVSDGRTLVDAPFTVGRARNRPPTRVGLRLDPAQPTSEDVIQCVVLTSPVTEDPDYAIARYRYRWKVGRKIVRTVRSAALADVLRHRLAKPGQRVSCTVSPSDGKRSGPSTSARVTVR